MDLNDDIVHKKRTQTVNEIVSTENDYLSNLMTLNLVYLRPIKVLLTENPKIVPENLSVCLLSIRSDIEVILGIQKQFMSDISQRTKNWEPTTLIADIFISFADPLKTYFPYMNHYQTIVPLLTQIKGTQFSKELENMKKPCCNGKGLRDFLIMPAQRIPRYLMLLIDLVKRTPTSHPDYNKLVEAKEKFEKLSDKVDQDLADFKSLEAVMQLSSSLIFKKKQKNFALVVPHRRYIMSSDAIILFGNHKKKSNDTKDGHIILFNDIILFCTHLEKQNQRKVEVIQFLEGIFFSKQTVNDKEAICFQYNPNGSSFLSIWPKDKKPDLYSSLVNRLKYSTKNTQVTVPVLKQQQSSPSSPIKTTKQSKLQTDVESNIPRSKSALSVDKLDSDTLPSSNAPNIRNKKRSLSLLSQSNDAIIQSTVINSASSDDIMKKDSTYKKKVRRASKPITPVPSAL